MSAGRAVDSFANRQASRHVARPGAPAQHGLGRRRPADALSRGADRHLSHSFEKLRRGDLCASLIVRVVTIATTNVHVQTQPKRIEIQFPTMLAASAFIGVTNHGVTAWGPDANVLQDPPFRPTPPPFLQTS